MRFFFFLQWHIEERWKLRFKSSFQNYFDDKNSFFVRIQVNVKRDMVKGLKYIYNSLILQNAVIK